MMMMMVTLYFNWNMNRLHNGLCMEMSMVFNRNVDTNSNQEKKKEKQISINILIHDFSLLQNKNL